VKLGGDPNQTGGVRLVIGGKEESIEEKEGKKPEYLSNDGTSDGLVAVGVPGFPHALVGSWAGPGHGEGGGNERKEKERVLRGARWLIVPRFWCDVCESLGLACNGMVLVV